MKIKKSGRREENWNQKKYQIKRKKEVQSKDTKRNVHKRLHEQEERKRNYGERIEKERMNSSWIQKRDQK